MKTSTGPHTLGWLVSGLVAGLGAGAALGWVLAGLGGDARESPTATPADPMCRAGYEPLMSYVDDGPPNERRLPMEIVRQRTFMTAYTLEHGDFDALSEAAVPSATSSGPEGRVAVTIPGQDGGTVAVFTYTATPSGWWLTRTSECVDPAQRYR